jgi:hypothetical protein
MTTLKRRRHPQEQIVRKLRVRMLNAWVRLLACPAVPWERQVELIIMPCRDGPAPVFCKVRISPDLLQCPSGRFLPRSDHVGCIDTATSCIAVHFMHPV